MKNRNKVLAATGLSVALLLGIEYWAQKSDPEGYNKLIQKQRYAMQLQKEKQQEYVRININMPDMTMPSAASFFKSIGNGIESIAKTFRTTPKSNQTPSMTEQQSLQYFDLETIIRYVDKLPKSDNAWPSGQYANLLMEELQKKPMPASLNPIYFGALGSLESGLNPKAVNKITGAKGFYQFLPGTWDVYMPNVSFISGAQNPKFNLEAAIDFSKDNYGMLNKNSFFQKADQREQQLWLGLTHQMGYTRLEDAKFDIENLPTQYVVKNRDGTIMYYSDGTIKTRNLQEEAWSHWKRMKDNLDLYYGQPLAKK